jgi:hypothetical protein
MNDEQSILALLEEAGQENLLTVLNTVFAGTQNPNESVRRFSDAVDSLASKDAINVKTSGKSIYNKGFEIGGAGFVNALFDEKYFDWEQTSSEFVWLRDSNVPEVEITDKGIKWFFESLR